jgi:hypothetical protein
LAHLDWISDQLTILAHCYSEEVTEERQEIYCADLREYPKQWLAAAFAEARRELKWFPKIAELRELAEACGKAQRDRTEEARWAEERKRLDQARARGEVADTPQLKAQLAKIVDAAKPPAREIVISEARRAQLREQAELIKKRNPPPGQPPPEEIKDGPSGKGFS